MARIENPNPVDIRGRRVLALYEGADGLAIALLHNPADPDWPYISARGYDPASGEWAQGRFFTTLAEAAIDADPGIVTEPSTVVTLGDVREALVDAGLPSPTARQVALACNALKSGQPRAMVRDWFYAEVANAAPGLFGPLVRPVSVEAALVERANHLFAQGLVLGQPDGEVLEGLRGPAALDAYDLALAGRLEVLEGAGGLLDDIADYRLAEAALDAGAQLVDRAGRVLQDRSEEYGAPVLEDAEGNPVFTLGPADLALAARDAREGLYRVDPPEHALALGVPGSFMGLLDRGQREAFESDGWCFVTAGQAAQCVDLQGRLPLDGIHGAFVCPEDDGTFTTITVFGAAGDSPTVESYRTVEGAIYDATHPEAGLEELREHDGPQTRARAPAPVPPPPQSPTADHRAARGRARALGNGALARAGRKEAGAR